jgi:hypothetical protein
MTVEKRPCVGLGYSTYYGVLQGTVFAASTGWCCRDTVGL